MFRTPSILDGRDCLKIIVMLQLVFAEVDEESVLIVTEVILTAINSIVEEHKCIVYTCKIVTKSSYSGTEPHGWPLS